MEKSTFSKAGEFDEEVIFCLERQMIPAWERYGLEHLAVSENTLAEFREQALPETMQCWTQKRKSNKPVSHKGTAKTNRIIKSWPEDDQVSVRFPVLMFVREGQAEVQMGDYVAACPQGTFLLFNPGVPRPAGRNPHLQEPLQGKQCEMWWFHSTGNNNFIALSVCHSKAEKHINSGHYYIVNDPQVAQLFHVFSKEVSDRPAGYEKTGFASLQIFLLLFLREIKAGRFYNRGVDNLPKSASMAESPIDMARQYIDKNLNHPLTIDIVAQAVFMGRTNFSRQFRKEIGRTFTEYLIERRLEEGKHWLIQESCTIDVVCKFIGLKNSRFHQLFRQRFGMTPKEFREKHKSV